MGLAVPNMLWLTVSDMSSPCHRGLRSGQSNDGFVFLFANAQGQLVTTSLALALIHTTPGQGASENAGHHPVRHQLAILVPVRAIFGLTPRVVSERTIRQQQRQENNVKVRGWPAEQVGQRPEEGGRDLRHVVEVPREAPPACAARDSALEHGSLAC